MIKRVWVNSTKCFNYRFSINLHTHSYLFICYENELFPFNFKLFPETKIYSPTFIINHAEMNLFCGETISIVTDRI